MVRVLSLLSAGLITRGLTAVLYCSGIQRLAGFGRLVGPLAQSVLYPHYIHTTLYLDIFRGEPAILSLV